MAPGGTLPAARRIAAQVPLPRYIPKSITQGAAKGPCSDCSPRESLLDFPEEEQHLCPECHLPLGHFGYENEAEDGAESDGDAPKPGQVLHGECKAQLILRSLQEEEQARLASEQELKSSRRAEYDIGWKADRIPDNAPHASELLGEAAQGLFCLVIDEDSHKVRVAPTTDPAAAVSLEYLSLALQVRKKEGREPLFSLDPEDDGILEMTCLDEEPVDRLEQVKELMQVKRFEPDWLAGTSVGEVMFQADYHLKELSMGEYEQPVLGMKNCWEHEMTDSYEQDWRAREWFVVKKADVLISDGDVLVPCVEMGVEAREQVVGKDGQVEDAMVTRPDHPLVKYAEAFTHFFDLIAERKSVVYHLRELAKASVLAKFLLDDALGLDDAWFQLAKAGGEDSHTQIPQLWNARQFSRIHMRGGEILHAGEDDDILATGSHAVYGGVEFGIDRIKEFPRFSKRIPSTEKPDFQLQSLAAARLPGRQLGSRGIPARLGVRPARSFGAALGPAASIMARPQGVDLNLDRFSLSSATRVASQEPAGSWASQEGTPLTGEAFWSTLSENSSEPLITKEDKSMLKALFNPHLSDRRAEGERFVPPETSPEYVQRLRTLLEEEEAMQQQRREHFFSKAFSVEDVGPLFPGAWNSKFAVARTEVLEKPPEHESKEWRVPREEEAEKLKEVLRSTAPSFDKTTEDGTRYRTYKVGNLEVRTTQEFNGQELVGAVFSDSPLDSAERPGAADGQVVVKATEYVERLDDRAAPPTKQPPPHGFFVVLLTESGDEILTERLEDGVVSWEVNPKDLAGRIALAKVTASVDCCEARVLAHDLKCFRDKEQRYAWRTSSSSTACKFYAHRLFSVALPPWEKPWASLTPAQRRAAEALGAEGEERWDNGAAGVWRSAWADLTKSQQDAAMALGVDQASWVKLQAARGAYERGWAELSPAERRAAEELGLSSPTDWDSAPPETRHLIQRSFWERTWAELKEEEQKAAETLGIADGDEWDSAAWEPQGLWAKRWHRLSEKEQGAASALGLTVPGLWEKAQADRLGNHWGVTAWDLLTLSQRATAGRLGYSRASWLKCREAAEA